MDIFEHFKNTYQKEIDRRVNLNGELSIPIGLITILSTGAFYYLTNYDFTNNKIWAIAFSLLLIAGGGFLIAAIIYLLGSYLVSLNTVAEYKYLAYPDEQSLYLSDLKDAFIKSGLDKIEAEKMANQKFEEYLFEAYVRTSANNTQINDRRAAMLFRCKKFILFALITLLLAFVPFAQNFFVKQKEHTQINTLKSVILLSDSVMNSKVNKSMHPKDTTQQPKPQTAPVNVVLPKPPADRHVKEGEIPITKKIFR